MDEHTTYMYVDIQHKVGVNGVGLEGEFGGIRLNMLLQAIAVS